jgi:hypothetical protein
MWLVYHIVSMPYKYAVIAVCCYICEGREWAHNNIQIMIISMPFLIVFRS